MYLEQVKNAYDTISDVVVKTPLLYSPVFSEMCGNGNKVYLKCENLQLTGAYKLRGALNKIRKLSTEQKSRGVVCASAGNHAQGVAYAATLEKINATIIMPETTPYLKVQATMDFGGKVILNGKFYDDAYKKACEISKEEGATFIHPFDDIDIIAGQGTVGLEILNQLDDCDIIVCPIGGGGLISGISTYAKSVNPNIKIIGVQADGASAMAKSFEEKKLIALDSISTIAEGIAVKRPGKLTFEIIKEYVDQILRVKDSIIVDRLLVLLEKHKLVAETSGVASLAALKDIDVKNKNIVCVISGGNIDMLTLSALINSGFVSRGRIFCFGVELANVPGQLLNVSALLTKLGGNIIRLEHNQAKARNKYQNVQLEITVETNGFSHIQRIKEAFEEAGYFITPQY